MGHALLITDGTTTLQFNNISYLVSEYTPQPPQMRYSAQDGVRDGGEIGTAYYQNVTETIEAAVLGSTTVEVQTNLMAIERLLHAARLRQVSRIGARTYIQYQLENDVNPFRSEILTGRVEIVKGGTAIWGNKHLPVRIHFTRRYYWEMAYTDVVVLTSKSQPSPAITGRSIHNHTDGTHGNYVDIASNQIAGVLPTPAKIILTNNFGSDLDYRRFHLATNANSDPANMSHFLEGEDCNGPVDQSSPVSSAATNSDTGYGSLTIGTTPAYFQWTLPASLLQDTQGRWFRLLARFHGYSGSNVKIKASIMDNFGIIPLFDGDEVALPNSSQALNDIGVLPFPPGGYDSAVGDHVLQLSVQSSSAGTANLDYVQLTPTESYRYIKMRTGPVVNGDSIVDDGTEEQTYQDESGDHLYLAAPRGEPLMLFPGKTQRIYILHDEGSGSNVNATTNVIVHYRPRRLTV